MKPRRHRPLIKHLTEPMAVHDALLTQRICLERSKYGQVLNLRRIETARLAEQTIRNKSIMAWQRAARSRKPPHFHEMVQEGLLPDYRGLIWHKDTTTGQWSYVEPSPKCQECDGTGRVHSHNDICWVCKGTGVVAQRSATEFVPHPPGTIGIAPEDAGPVQPGEPGQQDGRSDLAPPPQQDGRS